jgi:hypothetical protein
MTAHLTWVLYSNTNTKLHTTVELCLIHGAPDPHSRVVLPCARHCRLVSWSPAWWAVVDDDDTKTVQVRSMHSCASARHKQATSCGIERCSNPCTESRWTAQWRPLLAGLKLQCASWPCPLSMGYDFIGHGPERIRARSSTKACEDSHRAGANQCSLAPPIFNFAPCCVYSTVQYSTVLHSTVQCRNSARQQRCVDFLCQQVSQWSFRGFEPHIIITLLIQYIALVNGPVYCNSTAQSRRFHF